MDYIFNYSDEDFNYDQSIDILDLTIILNIILYEEYLQDFLFLLDLNGDENIDLLDIIILINSIIES